MQKINERFISLLKAINTPSGKDESPYTFAVIAIGHAMLGAVFSWFGLIAAALYWFVKERKDLKRGGAWLDGLVDTFFVALGTFYVGPIWWPISVMLLAGLGAVIKFNRV